MNSGDGRPIRLLPQERRRTVRRAFLRRCPRVHPPPDHFTALQSALRRLAPPVGSAQLWRPGRHVCGLSGLRPRSARQVPHPSSSGALGGGAASRRRAAGGLKHVCQRRVGPRALVVVLVHRRASLEDERAPLLESLVSLRRQPCAHRQRQQRDVRPQLPPRKQKKAWRQPPVGLPLQMCSRSWQVAHRASSGAGSRGGPRPRPPRCGP